MFYAHFVLAKKGPLARIWLAAHWDKKLTKAHVFETNIESSVEGILQPKVKMALRTSGHLLLGIVRIYSRKAKYLLADCNEAFIKIKMAFRPGAVDLPEEGRQAALSTITLPEVFHDFEATMPDLSNIDMEAAVTLNQSRAEDITLKEDYGSLSLINDDNFDMGFDDPEMAREATNIDEAFDQASLLLGGSMLGRPSEAPRGGPSSSADNEAGASSSTAENSALAAMPVPGESIEAGRNAREGEADPFGTAAASTEAEAAEGAREGALLEGEPSGLFEPAGLFDDAPLGHVPLDTSGSDRDGPLGAPGPVPSGPDARPADESDDDDDMYDMGPPSMGAPSGPSSPGSSVGDARDLDGGATTSAAAGAAGPSTSLAMPGVDDGLLDQQQQEQAAMPPPPQPPSADSAQMGGADVGPGEQTTLLNNEDESFALAPLDTTIVQGVEKARAKRKRKLIVDEVKNISGEEMKSQLSDTSDIVTTLDLAPPTKRLMHWKETGGVEKLFALPGRPILSKTLSRLYQRHLTTRAVENELAAGEEHLLQQLDDEQDNIGEQPQQMVQHDEHMQENSLGHHTKRRRLEEDLVGSHGVVNDQSAHHYDLGAPDFPHGGPPSHLGPPSVDHYAASMVPPPQHQEYQQPQPQTPLQDGWPTPADYTYAQPPHTPHTPVPDYTTAYQMQQQQQQQAAMMGHHPMAALHHPHHQQQLTPAPHLEEEHHQHHPVHHQAAAALFPTLQPDQLQSEYPVHPATPVPTPQSPPAAMMPPASQMGPPPTPQMMAPHTPQMQHQQAAQEESPSMDHPLAPPSEFDALVASGSALHGFGAPMESTSTEQHRLEEPEPQSEPQPEPHTSAEEQQQQQQQQDQLAQLDDDDEDYGPPASVGPAEEQLADETYEQFEERILNKRTVHMLHMIRSPLEAGRQVRFSDIARGSNRKQVAQKFYTFLVLKKQQAVELRQESAFAELYIEKGPKFEQSLL